MPKLDVKFLIDKEQKRVVLAEVGSDFIDVLFSFLTLPLGSIVRLLDKQSGLGSLDNLYKSVGQLDAKNLQTKACKEMLLNPRSAAAELCEDLKIKIIHNTKNIYACDKYNCCKHGICYYTYTAKSRCTDCGKQMSKFQNWLKKTTIEGGVFVNEGYDFMISHDLWVMPASVKDSCIYLKELEIKDSSILEERVMSFGTKEVLHLLQRSLVSKNALTEVCFPDTCMQSKVENYLPIKEEMVSNEAEHVVILKLLLNKKNSNVHYAEVGGDFLNQIVSFLTLPLGAVLGCLDNLSSGGCMFNLYKSVKDMDLRYFKSEICRNMLLNPKLSAHYQIKNQFLKIDQIAPSRKVVSGCAKCYLRKGFSCTSDNCKISTANFEFIEKNPKLSMHLINPCNDFIIRSRRFMIVNNLTISQLSFISFISNKMSLPISDLVSREACFDEDKAKSMLDTMLNSKTVLTEVFSHKQVHEKKNIFNIS